MHVIENHITNSNINHSHLLYRGRVYYGHVYGKLSIDQVCVLVASLNNLPLLSVPWLPSEPSVMVWDSLAASVFQ